MGGCYFIYFEGNTRSDDPRGQRAIQALDAALHSDYAPVFLAHRDFVAISNETCLHARHVEEIKDEEAHRNRWLLKTWNVDDISVHTQHLLPNRIHTSDE